MKTLRGRQYSFKQLTQFIMLNNMVDPLASNINDSLTRSTVLLAFTCMGHFGTKVMFHTHINTEIWQCSFKEPTQFTVLNKVLDPLASSINDSLTRDTVLFHSLERCSFAQS
jgi:hypothetical protein